MKRKRELIKTLLVAVVAVQVATILKTIAVVVVATLTMVLIMEQTTGLITMGQITIWEMGNNNNEVLQIRDQVAKEITTQVEAIWAEVDL